MTRTAETVRASLEIDGIVRDLRIVNWQNNADVKNRMRTAIEDMLFGLKDEYGIALTFEDIDEILEKCLEIARVRYPSWAPRSQVQSARRATHERQAV